MLIILITRKDKIFNIETYLWKSNALLYKNVALAVLSFRNLSQTEVFPQQLWSVHDHHLIESALLIIYEILSEFFRARIMCEDKVLKSVRGYYLLLGGHCTTKLKYQIEINWLIIIFFHSSTFKQRDSYTRCCKIYYGTKRCWVF